MRTDLETDATVYPKPYIFTNEKAHSDWSVENGAFAMTITQRHDTDGCPGSRYRLCRAATFIMSFCPAVERYPASSKR